jgi:hypothetical protein
MSKELIKVSKLNSAAKAIFEDFDSRQRFRRDINLKRFHTLLEEKHGSIDLQQFIETFKAIEALGLGTLVLGRGRRGDPGRFIWDYNLKDVAAAAKGEITRDQIEPLDGNEKYKEAAKKKVPASSGIRVYQPSSEAPTGPGASSFEIIVVNPVGGTERISVPAAKEGLFREFMRILQS